MVKKPWAPANLHWKKPAALRYWKRCFKDVGSSIDGSGKTFDWRERAKRLRQSHARKREITKARKGEIQVYRYKEMTNWIVLHILVEPLSLSLQPPPYSCFSSNLSSVDLFASSQSWPACWPQALSDWIKMNRPWVIRWWWLKMSCNGHPISPTPYISESYHISSCVSYMFPHVQMIVVAVFVSTLHELLKLMTPPHRLRRVRIWMTIHFCRIPWKGDDGSQIYQIYWGHLVFKQSSESYSSRLQLICETQGSWDLNWY